MYAEELTKEQVEEMSDEEVVFWFKQFAEREQVSQMRKRMLDQIEIRDADESRVIQIDSKGVDHP